MRRIGVRERRQNASRWLRQVESGESFEITDRGHLVAMLIPPPVGSVLEKLVATGRASAPSTDVLDLGPPRPAEPGVPSLSEILTTMRADER